MGTKLSFPGRAADSLNLRAISPVLIDVNLYGVTRSRIQNIRKEPLRREKRKTKAGVREGTRTCSMKVEGEIPILFHLHSFYQKEDLIPSA